MGRRKAPSDRPSVAELARLHFTPRQTMGPLGCRCCMAGRVRDGGVYPPTPGARCSINRGWEYAKWLRELREEGPGSQ